MDPIRRLQRPSLRRPRAVLAFEGWNDASDAASGAAAFLLGQQDQEDPFAILEPEEFYDFQQRRPTVTVDDGDTRSLIWPATRFFALDRPDDPAYLVVGIGEEPHLRWKTFARSIAQLLGESDVDLAVTLGAFIGQVAHTRPVPVLGVATDPSLLQRHGLSGTNYEGPTGIVGVLLEAFRESGIPAVSLWAACPHYLAANPNPAAMLALTRAAAEVTGVAIDTAELEALAAEFTAKVDEAMSENPEFLQYVERIEADSDGRPGGPIDPSESGMLITEIEQFLRGRDA